MASSPTKLSLALLSKEGWTCEVTERWNPFAKIRQDLFGFCDILCLGDGKFMAVQTTSFPNARARIKKILAEPRAEKFMQAGGRIRVHGWKKRGPRGGRKVWTLSEFSLSGEVLMEIVP